MVEILTWKKLELADRTQEVCQLVIPTNSVVKRSGRVTTLLHANLWIRLQPTKRRGKAETSKTSRRFNVHCIN
jgi:hypothetical protein